MRATDVGRNGERSERIAPHLAAEYAALRAAIPPYKPLPYCGGKALPKTCLMVRSVVSDAALRENFEHWYAADHLPWALDVFKAEKAWRYWSAVDAGVHYAVYQFADMGRLEAAMKSPGFKALVADYDRTWPKGVTRTRDILSLVEERDGAP
jgi:hypothetical protein